MGYSFKKDEGGNPDVAPAELCRASLKLEASSQALPRVQKIRLRPCVPIATARRQKYLCMEGETCYRQNSGRCSGYRYYHPEMGRWISRDPIWERGGLLLYGFVENDPISGSDKHGLSLTDDVTQCQSTIKSFILKNKLHGTRFDFSNPPISDFPKLTCLVDFKCDPCCGDNPQTAGAKGWFKGSEATVNGKTWKRCLVRVCVYEGKVTPFDWEVSFTHELQHCQDYCKDVKKLDCTKETDLLQKRICECAYWFCSEYRASQHHKPKDDAAKVVEDYWGRHETKCLPGVTKEAVANYLESHCDVKTDMLPSEGYVYSPQPK